MDPRASLLAAVDGIACVVESERAEGDRLGLLTEAAMHALVDSGLLRLKLPVEVGGYDADGPTQFAVLERLARADGATAWCAMAMGTAGAWASSRLPDAGVAEITGGAGWPICAGTFPFSGLARREPGGWRVQGRWGFASGIRNATWVACAAMVDARGGPPDVERVCLVVPQADVVIEDTWQVDGLRATGSTHYHIDDLYVPDARAFQLEGPPRRGGPTHRLPPLAYLVGDHIAVGLGLARRALDEITAESRARVRLGSTTATAARGHFEHELGRLDLALRSARALLEAELHGMSSAVRAGSRPEPRDVVRARATAGYAAHCVVEAALFAHRMSGAGGVLDDGPRRRAVMDALTLTQHIYLNDEVLDAWGRALVEKAD